MDEALERTHASRFRDMAERIEKVKPEEFGGAFIIIDPNGHVLDGLMASSYPSLAAFWAHVKSRVEITALDLEQQARTAENTGFRRRI